MKKKMLATTLLTGLLAACSGNSASVTGVWIEPIPGMEDQVQGIKPVSYTHLTLPTIRLV